MLIVFLSWSWRIDLLVWVLLAPGKNLLIRGPIVLVRLLVKVVLRSHLEMAVWVDLVFLGEHLSIVRQVLFGTDLQASERLSA
jgi:hypothetical protein